MGYYLFDHPNPHAPVRSNGIRFHGYPQRSEPIRHLVIHTAENTPDYVGVDGGAEAVARYQTGVDRPSSYHEIGDSDSFEEMLPDVAVAFGAKGANSDGWHYSFATRAHLWGSLPKWWIDRALDLAARRCALRAAKHDIPVRRLSQAQYRRNEKGFVAHGDVDPGRRSDPGSAFPWSRFLALVAHYLEDDEMTDEDRKLLRAINKRLEEVQRDVSALKKRVPANLPEELDMLRRGVRADLEASDIQITDGP